MNKQWEGILQEKVDGKYEANVLNGKTDRLENDDHSDQTSTWYARGSYRCDCGGKTAFLLKAKRKMGRKIYIFKN